MLDASKQDFRDSRRININERWEMNYWCQLLGVDAKQLRNAVNTVGDMASDVRSYLAKSGASN